MKVLHVDTGRGWRGGERQVLSLALGLQKLGVENVIVPHPFSPLDQAARRNGLKTVAIRIGFDLDPTGIFSLGWVLRKEKPEILHLHCAHSHAAGVVASLLFRHRCVRVLSRRVDFRVRRNPFSWFKYRVGLDSIIAISEGVKEALVKSGLGEGKISVIRSGIELERFQRPLDRKKVRAELGISTDAKVVGSVAALAPHKAQNYLIDAAFEVLKKHPDTFFMVAGEGELRSKLERRVARLGIGERFLFLGFRSDVEEVLAAMDIFVLSSYLEGLCTSLMDAMASGLPIVATRVGGVPEIVDDGLTGFLVPPRDSTALAQAISKLLEDESLAEAMARRAKEKSRSFSIETTVRKTWALYRRLLCRVGEAEIEA